MEDNPIKRDSNSDMPAQSPNDGRRESTSEIGIKIQKLREEIEDVEIAFQFEATLLRYKIWLWGIMSVVAIAALLFIFWLKLFQISFSDKWSWQVVYYTAIRVTFITLFVSIIAFCLKMLRFYINLNEKNRHKIAVIRAIPTLILVSDDVELIRIAYKQIIKMLVLPHNMEALGKEPEINSGGNFAADLINELIKKRQ